LKQDDDAIHAFCGLCRADEFLIYGWEDTRWAAGPMEPLDTAMMNAAAGSRPREVRAGDRAELLQRALDLLGSPMRAAEALVLIATADQPMTVLNKVMESLPEPPSKDALDRFMGELVGAWNETPRPELGGAAPSELYEAAPLKPKVGRNQPCPCGSGRKFKRCCGRPSNLH